jgi:hypothetical protein
LEARDFCYWLQGFLEISGADKLTPEQVKIINDHLQLVFKKVTPGTTIAYSTPQSAIAGIGGTGVTLC